MPLAVQYSYRLIVVSILISMVSAYAAFALADRTHHVKTRAVRWGWLLGGSCAMGAGIWSMHYLGMLAMELPVEVFYFLPTVAVSLTLAICASAVALVIVGGKEPSWKRLGAGGALMGAGIGGMHYTGMSAMRMSAANHYSMGVVALSIVIAVGFSWVSLWLGVLVRNQSRYGEWLRVLAAVVMGSGIASMHYIAMAGMMYMPNAAVAEAGAWVWRVGALGITGVALTTFFILLAALGMAALDKRLFRELEASHLALLEVQKSLTEANLKLTDLSIRDGLTGIFNRRHFDDILEAEWRRAVRFRRPLSLLMMDVDHFKALNDTYGHPRGDHCLREIAGLLEKGPRRGYDLVARIGGEEFAVLLPGAEADGAQRIAEIIRAKVQSLDIANKMSPSGFLTVSIGVSSWMPRSSDIAEDMMREADEALYAAKRLGRNRVAAGRLRPSEFREGEVNLGPERARN
jgi:diguanylate cyclase (GGDEF)-like protein